jgi:hypothetical protein
MNFIRRVVYYKKQPGLSGFLAHLENTGWYCEDDKNGAKVYVEAQGYQELYVLLKVLAEMEKRYDVRRLWLL